MSDLSASDLVPVEGGDTIAVGNVPVSFVHTPGHTPGSQCFLVAGNLISGDTLFIGSCGRTDLPGSDPADLYRSLNDTLRNLPDDTVLYPGHNYADRPTLDDRATRSAATCSCASSHSRSSWGSWGGEGWSTLVPRHTRQPFAG